MKFKVASNFKPTGDQPFAIEKLTKGLMDKKKNQVLLGVTGSGKTFTIANVIERTQKPTLVISHNKTLAAQLYQELRDFFPENAVSYFVSYYDYYQPEAYVPTTDTYIAKETEINDEIDKLRLAATTNILTRNDTIVVASVSCIYNIGSPLEFGKFAFEIKKGVKLSRKSILDRLLDLMYTRNDYGFKRSSFRVRGDTIEVHPASEDYSLRIALAGDEVESIKAVNPVSGEIIGEKEWAVIYPAKHYITEKSAHDGVFPQIKEDLAIQTKELRDTGKLLEAERLQKRTEYDLKMIKELGYVNGIENYSRYFDGRKPGDPPYTLMDYFDVAAKGRSHFDAATSKGKSHFDHDGRPWLLIIDESHMTIPQIHGMYNGDRARKSTLINFGFRLPSALDNRPLKFEEFMKRTPETIYMSATPSEWELKLSGQENVAEQLIRPTGVVDPSIEIRPTEGQIEDLMKEIKVVVARGERVLVTTLTKRMSEDLATFFEEREIKVKYLHSEIETLDRQDILDDLREGKVDVLVGINLLREGLDLPEVSLVAILDADKEGFLRSRTSLIQIMGRAARRVDARVILYADNVTFSMSEAIQEVDRRRTLQLQYNKENNITATTIEKAIKAKLVNRKDEIFDLKPLLKKEVLLPDERDKVIKQLRRDMQQAAKDLDFETAALIRDKIRYIRDNI